MEHEFLPNPSLKAWKHTHKAILVFICLAAVVCARAQQPDKPQTNDQRARELLDSKTYIFEDLLRGDSETFIGLNAESQRKASDIR